MDAEAGDRHALACRIIEKSVLLDCRLTLQSVSEFYAVVTRKRLVTAVEAAAQADDWLVLFRTVPASATAIRAAMATVASRQASYWDALLVATAAEAGCTTILTEDMGDGTSLLGVRILNPFATGILSPAAAVLLTAS